MQEEVGRGRWGVRRRLEFVEARLFWCGRLNRSDLCANFGISVAQASADVARYEALAPSNLSYDRTAKAYRRAPGFEPALIGPTVEAELCRFAAVDGGRGGPGHPCPEEMPPLEVVGLGREAIDPLALLRLLDAIRHGREVDVGRPSLAGSVGASRGIAPHGLFRAGGRWHVRAWSRGDDAFVDVDVHGLTAAEAGPSVVDPALDFEWAHLIDLVIVPNLRLPSERWEVVAERHAMVDGRLKRPFRLSTSAHLISAHNLDLAPGVLDPERQPLVLQNLDDVVRARDASRQLAGQALARSRGGGAKAR